MFALLRRLTMAGGIAAFLNTPTGRQLVARAKTMANDPATRQKLTNLVSKVIGRRATPGGLDDTARRS